MEDALETKHGSVSLCHVFSTNVLVIYTRWNSREAAWKAVPVIGVLRGLTVPSLRAKTPASETREMGFLNGVSR